MPPGALLREVDGVGVSSINQLKLIAAAATRVAKGELQQRTQLSSWNDVIDYCRASMAFADKEQFRILFLDKRNQLISDEVAADRHRRPHASLPARGDRAGAGIIRDRADARDF
jgi:DNA repair protein RadC